MSSCSSTICWKDYSLSIELLLHLHQKLNGQIFNGSVSGLSALLHWSVYLPLYQNFGFHLLLASIQKCGSFLYVDFLSCCTDLSVLGILFSNSFWFSTQSSVLPANRDRFVYSFPNCISFISFSYYPNYDFQDSVQYSSYLTLIDFSIFNEPCILGK